ncbi:MAG: DUF1304 domain-containing protein [Gammaproteobacteria bacterium]|nr:DUF1304 domain-containing protein [Gammaproteobacteria bacterium]
MAMIINTLIGLVVILHVYFLVLEMFLWDKPFGLRIFGHTLESARASKVLAMNQGLYNGFLASGLVWGMSQGVDGNAIKIFFLSCVVIAGVFGGVTANRKIFLIQALPAMVALILVIIY